MRNQLEQEKGKFRRDDMKLKEALKSKYRFRHVSTIMECLKIKDGLSFGELYVEYCKLCKKEEVEPAGYNTINTVVRRLVYKGFVRKEHFIDHGKCGVATRFWLVK